MAPRITLTGLEANTRPVAPGPVRRLRSGPGEFTFVSLLWAGLALYSITQGFADDRAPLVVVGATSFAIVLIGSIWPIVALRSVQVAVEVPSDAVVGQLVPVQVELRGRARNLRIRLSDPVSEWVHADAPSRGEIRVVAPHRGVIEWVRVEVKCAGPMNVFVRHRSLALKLASPLWIAPVVVAADPALAPIERDDAALVPTVVHGTDTVRSTRPYVSGDPARSVHWPTTARTGELVVREFEPPAATGLAVVVDLRSGTPEAVERAASLASGTARAVLARGGQCVLVTAAPEATVTPVVSLREIDRTLAAAGPGEPGPTPSGWPVLVIRP